MSLQQRDYRPTSKGTPSTQNKSTTGSNRSSLSSSTGSISPSPQPMTTQQKTTDTNDSAQGWGSAKYTVPCRYYKFGTCKLGDQCRFLHADKPDDKPQNQARKGLSKSADDDESSSPLSTSPFGYSSAESSQNSNEDGTPASVTVHSNVPPNVRFRFSRRPFIHIVVLFAGDAREFIKTENLAEIVTTSKADQVIVLGDRNMKNHSCQAKRKGKLVEMKLDEIIDCVWSEWPDSGNEKSNVSTADLGSLSPFNKSTEEQFYNLMEKFTGLRHLKERLTKLETGTEISELRNPSSEFNKLGRVMLDANNQPTYSDEKMAAKLTNRQKTIIRLHQQLLEALDTLRNTPVENQKTATNSGRGKEVTSSYAPTELRSGIPVQLRDKLLKEVESLLSRVEELGDELLEFISPLWASYRQEYSKNKKPTPEEKPQKKPSNTPAAPAAPSSSTTANESWSCDTCTFVNHGNTSVCEICSEPRKEQNPDDEWSLTGAAGKKQRKQRAIQQEAETKKKVEKVEKPAPKVQDAKPAPVKAPVVVAKPAIQSHDPPVSSSWKTTGSTQFSSVIQPPAQRIQKPVSPSPLSASPFDFATISNPKPSTVPTPEYNSNYPPLNPKLSNPPPNLVQQPSQGVKYQPQLQQRLQMPVNNGFSQVGQMSSPQANDIPTDFSSEFSKLDLNGEYTAESNDTQPDYLHNSLFNPTVWSNQTGLFPGAFNPPPMQQFNNNVSNQQELFQNWMSGGAFAPQTSFPFQALYQPSTFTTPTVAFPTTQPQTQQMAQPSQNQDQFEQPKRRATVQRPCCYCGEESYLECNRCAKIGMATYFCSPDHQSLVWKDHLEYHKQSDLPVFNKF